MALAAVAYDDASVLAVEDRVADTRSLATQKWPSAERFLIETSPFFDVASRVFVPSGHDH
jgi:hypothetical protein